MKRALLIGLNVIDDYDSCEYSLDELENLALAVEIKTVDKIIQNAKEISNKYYIGSGKVEEIKNLIPVLDIEIIIFDTTLSPAQLKNLENALDCEVIDRSFLILSIFAERAKTKEAVLEVSLAQKEYMLPRLIGMGKVLSRQGGGSTLARGPGETKLELDRRRLLREIVKIRKDLREIKAEKELTRKRRKKNNIPIVALVGYTNAGKSSLMNSLSFRLNHPDDDVFEKDMLFATLDTKARRLRKENRPPFILIDTVGFIDKLPHELLRSFETTLSDVINADLLIHVVDGAHFSQTHIDTVKHILKIIDAGEIERLMVVTKKDIMLSYPKIGEDYLLVSNKTKEGIDELIDSIYGNLFSDSQIVFLKIPFDKGEIYSRLKENNTILDTQYLEDGIHVKTILSPNEQVYYHKYIEKK